MIVKNRADELFEITCDRCAAGSDEVPLAQAATFDVAAVEFHKRGWRPYRDSPRTVWKHRCPDCINELKAEAGRLV
ncbi:MAG: hypothetical protein WD118_08835 [Phycisphaeraceae bacterium]